MEINSRRLLDTLRDLREFTDTPGCGVTRFSYGEQDAKARQYIMDIALACGCSVQMDEIGNIRIGLGTNVPGRPVVLCGSHIDTVRNGGWLDGVYGVCGALEVLRTLAENTEAVHGEEADARQAGDEAAGLNYEMVIFAEEEGSNFGSTMTGSKFIAGKYKDEDLDHLADDTGRTLRQVLADWNPSDTFKAQTGAAPRGLLTVPWDLSNAAAMLELHIEQGPVLDWAGIPIGIVDSIFGMRVIEVTMSGVGNHAGATPMNERSDALCAAAEGILEAEKIVRADPEERTVVTVGKMEVQPNCSNVIPETVRFTLEVRDRDVEEIDGNMDRIITELRVIALHRGVHCSVRELSKSSPLHLNGHISEIIRGAADAAGIEYRVMDSGAVHDACMIAETGVPTGMIFVPSIEGRSHVPEEDTREKDLITGAQLLMAVIQKLLEGESI